MERLRWITPALLGVALFIPFSSANAQQTLHNDDIVKMHAAGLSNEIITSTIANQSGVYSTTVDDLIALKKAGLDDKVIKAIIDKNSPSSQATADPADANMAPASAMPAGDGPASSDQPSAPNAAPIVVRAPDGPANKPRVFLTSASHGNTTNAARDQSMEMSKDFERECPSVRISINQQVADYTVLLNHIEVGLFIRDNQIQIADKNGDLISRTKEGGSIAGGIKKACDLILSDWNKPRP
jgi:hypothetical protein